MDQNHHDLNARLTKLEARAFAQSCMLAFVGARLNALRFLMRSYFEETGVHFHPTHSFDRFFKGLEDKSLDSILSGFADDDATLATEMRQWLQKARE